MGSLLSVKPGDQGLRSSTPCQEKSSCSRILSQSKAYHRGAHCWELNGVAHVQLWFNLESEKFHIPISFGMTKHLDCCIIGVIKTHWLIDQMITWMQVRASVSRNYQELLIHVLNGSIITSILGSAIQGKGFWTVNLAHT
jgi:hypothetical protein